MLILVAGSNLPYSINTGTGTGDIYTHFNPRRAGNKVATAQKKVGGGLGSPPKGKYVVLVL
jgi:hypothetical protein